MNLIINNLHFKYNANQPVLNDVQLAVSTGEIHGILGENGAGKTTLFRLIAGWIPVPDSSIIEWNGGAVHKDQVAFLEAEPYFYPYMTGREYLRFIRDDTAKIDRWNQLFNLPLDTLFADDYSTGMKKKLALLATLLQQRPVVILDEPFNGVDFEGNETIMAILRQGILRDSATFISSHILHTLTQVCDRISVLSNGKIVRTVEKAAFGALADDIQQRTNIAVAEMMKGWSE